MKLPTIPILPGLGLKKLPQGFVQSCHALLRGTDHLHARPLSAGAARRGRAAGSVGPSAEGADGGLTFLGAPELEDAPEPRGGGVARSSATREDRSSPPP